MCDHIFKVLLTNDYIRILDHHVKPSIKGQMYCNLHDSFEHSIESCNMFHQIVQSAIDKGRLKFLKTHVYDQSTVIGFDGKKWLHRLPQAILFKDVQVHTEDGGIKSSSK
jgi:hypothetical protein